MQEIDADGAVEPIHGGDIEDIPATSLIDMIPHPQENQNPVVPSAARALAERTSIQRLGLERIRVACEWVTVPGPVVAFRVSPVIS